MAPGGNPAIQGDHSKVLGDLAKKGVGLGFAHFACEVPKDKGGQQFLDWIGGYYEDRVSCNPMWAPEYKQLPSHALTRGVQPFTSGKDEWYFNIHFRPEMKDITPSSWLSPRMKCAKAIMFIRLGLMNTLSPRAGATKS